MSVDQENPKNESNSEEQLPDWLREIRGEAPAFQSEEDSTPELPPETESTVSEIEELPEAMANNMKAYLGVPSTFFTDKTPVETIKQYAGRIVNTLRGRVFMNIGDILPADGDIFKAIEMGKWVAERF